MPNQIAGPDPIELEQARNMTRMYTMQYNPDLENTMCIHFEIDKMELMISKLKQNPTPATHVRVYLGARFIDGIEYGTTPKIQPTVFFQGARLYSGDDLRDIDPSEENPTTFDFGHVCNPPKCNGRSLYYNEW